MGNLRYMIKYNCPVFILWIWISGITCNIFKFAYVTKLGGSVGCVEDSQMLLQDIESK